jgi:hypothetical protein
MSIQVADAQSIDHKFVHVVKQSYKWQIYLSLHTTELKIIKLPMCWLSGAAGC